MKLTRLFVLAWLLGGSGDSTLGSRGPRFTWRYRIRFRQLMCRPIPQSPRPPGRSWKRPRRKCAITAVAALSFSKVPPVRMFPRLGYFFLAPTGPGYYSLHDVCTGTYRAKPPRFPYPPVTSIASPSFEYDYRFLDEPGNPGYGHTDCLHRIHLGDNWLFNTGGQVTTRYVHESDSRLSGRTNDFQLLRYPRLRRPVVPGVPHVRRVHRPAALSIRTCRPIASDVNRSGLPGRVLSISRSAKSTASRRTCAGPAGVVGLRLAALDQRPGLVAGAAQLRRRARLPSRREVGLRPVLGQPVIPNPSHIDSHDNNQNLPALVHVPARRRASSATCTTCSWTTRTLSRS